MPCHFEIPGPVCGYVHGGRLRMDRAKAKRYRRYDEWRDKVRLLANCAGIPDEIGGDDVWSVSLGIYWERRARIDGDGILKGVLDALWTRDRRVLFGRYSTTEYAGEPECVRITVRKVSVEERR